eukprot:jgi/Psemu1/56518/gm1.56518_g
MLWLFHFAPPTEVLQHSPNRVAVDKYCSFFDGWSSFAGVLEAFADDIIDLDGGGFVSARDEEIINLA